MYKLGGTECSHSLGTPHSESREDFLTFRASCQQIEAEGGLTLSRQQASRSRCRESYSWEHYQRLKAFEYRRPFDTREKVRCVDVHPRTVPKCALCTTCHFCR